MSAIHPGRTRQQAGKRYRAEVERAWDEMVLHGQLGERPLRPLVSASWQRCLAQGVAPTAQLPPLGADEARLAGLRQDHHELVFAAHNTWQMLADILADTQSLLLVTDPVGTILDARGSGPVVDRGAELGVTPGYEWSEQGAGTNAVGTAIATGAPAEVESVEHFCAIAKVWACAAAPVRDATDGALLGIIDVTTFGDAWHGHSLALALTTAHQIEQTLKSRELARSVQLLQWYQANFTRWSEHPLLLIDRKGRIVTCNAQAQAVLRASELASQRERGQPLLALAPRTRNDEVAAALPPALRAGALEAYGQGGEWQGGLLVLDRQVGAPGARSRRSARGDAWLAHFTDIVGAAEPLTELKYHAWRYARAAAPVLLLGETGTGKELFARAIHRASARAAGPFVAVNCGTLSRELAASELLGYAGGAFTGALARGHSGKFEQADGGTLFLDEVGELSPDVQVALLRVLQDQAVVPIGGHAPRQVDVRVIAATNRDLAEAVASGHFRRDLYYRLKVLELSLPPLRERLHDVVPLAEHALAEFARRDGGSPRRLTPELAARLLTHDWPGNVRELRALMERMCVLSDDDALTSADLPPDFATAPAVHLAVPAPTMAALARDAIVQHLARHAGNRARAARSLGISRSTLYRKLREFGLE